MARPEWSLRIAHIQWDEPVITPEGEVQIDQKAELVVVMGQWGQAISIAPQTDFVGATSAS
jgi:hypothetical protein